ncbi:GIY-YIG nuclease family protein [Cellvibrio sp. OA-2007]|uniref:GIY-YIG nuclease family protein n=1 Tax=Cellvibrio sp. OA-2007 TaxID=529823 RepID=UPI0007864FF5|nr:GIY-YIG nuclease family protein [Cellvibrio sp. OA-2007]
MTSSNHWFVYMIRTSDAQVYTGITTDMTRRWREHASGKTGARYFRGRKPVQLCYLEAEHNRSSASQREYAIKSLSSAAKRELIAAQSANTQALIALHQLGDLPH